MGYFDQHSHCRCSPDSDTPLRSMMLAARDHGMELVCVTDHVDMDDDVTGHVCPTWPAVWPLIRREWEEYLSDPVPGIQVRMGIELGEIHHAPEVAAQAAARPEWDLVLGSLHNLLDVQDFYHIPYQSEEECAQWHRRYLSELLELAKQPCFDVMAHIGYTSRYMHRRGFSSQITVEEHREELTALFRALIDSGRGIEVNVSGLREGHTTYPTAPVLSLYRELGGEIVTVGSDAHTPESAGIGVKEGFDLLAETGFRYVARYSKRKPEFIRIV